MKTCYDCIGYEYDICPNYYTEEDIKEYTDGDIRNTCRRFKDKSKFIELPCSIGDTIWCIPKNIITPIPFEVIGEPTIPIYHSLVDTFVNISDFGKIAFSTREEAEKKLKEISNE